MSMSTRKPLQTAVFRDGFQLSRWRPGLGRGRGPRARLGALVRWTLALSPFRLQLYKAFNTTLS